MLKLLYFMLQAMHSISLMSEVSSEKFLSDIKLLLFGIDSDSFRYDTVVHRFNHINTIARFMYYMSR